MSSFDIVLFFSFFLSFFPSPLQPTPISIPKPFLPHRIAALPLSSFEDAIHEERGEKKSFLPFPLYFSAAETISSAELKPASCSSSSASVAAAAAARVDPCRDTAAPVIAAVAQRREPGVEKGD
jgi:hypothetical protein